MGQIIKDQKEMNRKISYEDISSDLNNNMNMSYYIDSDDVGSDVIIKKLPVDRLSEDKKSEFNQAKSKKLEDIQRK